MKVVILGDAHGNWTALNQLLTQARDRLGAEAGIQVGDFGIDRNGLKHFANTERRFVLPLHAIDGNHDDHPFLARAVRRGEAQGWPAQFNLHFQTRGSMAQFADAGVGFLGGALHVASPQRHGWLSGAPNYLRRREAVAAAERFNTAKPQLIVTHSCPSGIGIGMRGNPLLDPGLREHVVNAGFDPGPNADRGETALRTLWDRLHHRPNAWVFGHFHLSWQAKVEETQFICVPAVDAIPVGEVLCWDTATGILSQERF